MAPTFSVETTIANPSTEVWAALTDWENAPKWIRGIDRMEADGGTATGTKLTFFAHGSARSSVIADCDASRSIRLRSVQGGVTADYSYALHPIGEDGTRVTLVADCRSEGFWWRAISPFIRVAIRLTDGKQLEGLKRLIEGR